MAGHAHMSNLVAGHAHMSNLVAGHAHMSNFTANVSVNSLGMSAPSATSSTFDI